MFSFIELFAGCGGLSLGLRSAGFKELLANELSSMPAETFALNLMGVDIRSDEFAATAKSKRQVLWIDASSEKICDRLIDNPFERPQTDMSEIKDAGDLTGRLIVGDIRRLNTFIEEQKKPIIKGEVDLVSGGPPCQSFSLAGRREFGNQRNQLPWEFAKFVDSQRPKMVLLENVEGILRPFKLENKTYHAWFEVCKAFASIGYITCPMLINARFTGVAQNRPRFIMFGLREDLIEHLAKGTTEWFKQGIRLRKAIGQSDIEYDSSRWEYKNMISGECLREAKCSVFAPLVAYSQANQQHTVYDAIADLEDEESNEASGYVNELNRIFHKSFKNSEKEITNTNHPDSSPRVRARFRVYQIIANSGKNESAEIKAALHGDKAKLSKSSVAALKNGKLIRYGNPIPRSNQGLVEYLNGLHTKKFSQKALKSNYPAPAALSIPDDICHYSEARTLSVREMARIQSFPDAFEFRGIATTGGLRRRYQVPQYTQIGNAVPPLMGRALGDVASAILKELR